MIQKFDLTIWRKGGGTKEFSKKSFSLGFEEQYNIGSLHKKSRSQFHFILKTAKEVRKSNNAALYTWDSQSSTPPQGT